MIAVGLMSGTSLDGIDAALCRIVPRVDGYDVELLNFATTPFSNELADEIRAALPPMRVRRKRLPRSIANSAKRSRSPRGPLRVRARSTTSQATGRRSGMTASANGRCRLRTHLLSAKCWQ